MNDYGGSSATSTLPAPDAYGDDDALRLLLGKKPPKRRPLPKLEDLKDEIARVRQLNQLRNDSYQIRRDIVGLAGVVAKQSRHRQTHSDKDDFVMRLSWPDTVLQQTVNTLGRIEIYNHMRAEDNTEEAEEAAEKPIALVDTVTELLEDDYTYNGGPLPLLMAMAQYAVRDGALVQKLCRRPNDARNIWDYEIIDPMEVYPVYIGKRYVRCYRISLLKVQDIRAQWGEGLLKDRKDDEELEVVACYDDYYHAIFTSADDENWLKPPKPHEYSWGIPIHITYFRGQTGSRGDQQSNQTDEQVEANRSRGIFDPIVDELQQWARIQTALTDKMMLTVRPPIVVKSEKGTAADVKVNRNANGRTNLDEGEDLEEFPNSNADLQYITALSQQIVAALENATLPIQAMQKHQSGFLAHITEKQAADFFEPFLKGLKIALRWRARAILLCFRQFGDQMMVNGQSARGKPYLWQFTPDLIPADPQVIVEFSDISPLDRVQLLGALAPIYAAGGIDTLTAFGPQFLKMKDPHLIVERVREEQLWKHPGALQVLVPAASVGVLERMLKDAVNRGHVLQAEVLKAQIKQLSMSILAPPPQMPGQPPGMGAGGPPGGGDPMQMMQMLAQQGGPQGPPLSLPAPQGPPPMAAPAQLPPDMATGNADQLTPDILAQRQNGRLPIGGF